MGEHTPGPWRISGKRSIRKGESDWIATIHWRNREANAHLIAAAPDLLAMLKAARLMLEQYVCDATGEHFNSPPINAAIAKAEGHSS